MFSQVHQPAQEVQDAGSTLVVEVPSEAKLLRKLTKFRAAGQFSALSPGLSCRRATSINDLRDAYHLVYKNFIHQGYIQPYASEMRVRPYEASPETATFIGVQEESVIGVCSSILDSEDLKLPSDGAFGAELDELRNSGSILTEFSNQATDPNCRQTTITTELMRCVYAQAWHDDATDIVCAVSPKQRSFFSLIGFTQVGEIKSYSDVVFDPVALIRLADIQSRWAFEPGPDQPVTAYWRRYFLTENPYMDIIPFWNGLNQRLFANPQDLNSLFADSMDQMESWTEDEREAIHQRTGLEIQSSPQRDSIIHML